MKILLIIGILLLVGALLLADAGSKPLTSLSPLGEKTVTISIIVGLLLIGWASIMYLKKQ